MKHALLVSLLCAINTVSIAQPNISGYQKGIVINNGYYSMLNNYSAFAQCQEMNEAQINMLSKTNMENQVCVYETYTKLTEKYINNPPEKYIPPKSVVITFNHQEQQAREKEQLRQINNICQSLAVKMREKLKLMYGVDNLVCK